MHQIDENKDSAMYNAYMGVDDIGYKHPLNDERHRYYSAQRPSHNTHAPKHRPYVSRRMPPDAPTPPHGAMHRTQSSPAMYYSKNRHRPSYNHHNYTASHPSSYYAYSHPHPHPPPHPHYEGAPPPPPHHHHYPPPPMPQPQPQPSKSYQAQPPSQADPYDYYSRNHSAHYTYFSPHPPSKSDKSQSPQMLHIPSKAMIPPSKAPPKSKASQAIERPTHVIPKSPPIIMEVPSLLTKKASHKKKDALSSPKLVDKYDIETTKLEEETADILADIKTPKFALSRQYSEPDAKAMRDIERDLNALPLTPPFDPNGNVSMNESDLSGLGLPTNLMYAKTTPLSLQHDDINEESHTAAYGNVNDVYYMTTTHARQPRQPRQPPPPLPLILQPMPQPHAPQPPPHAQMMRSKANLNAISSDSSRFDFAMFDLNEQLKLIKRELSELEEEIARTDSKTIQCENKLKRTNIEKEKVRSKLAIEKMILEKSLKPEQETQITDEEEEAAKINEFWNKHRASLRREVERLRTKNMAASASADVMHKHLRSQLDAIGAELAAMKRQRQKNRNRNMRFELEVIELTESVNNLKDSVDCQRHDNFLALSKQKEGLMVTQQSQESKSYVNAMEYPPEIVIQENLIRAQVEFYFSDYNLKRDKRLLEKICKEPRRGYLSVTEVLGLSRVRQLCNTSHQLYDALSGSLYIDMILSEEEEERRLNDQNENNVRDTKETEVEETETGEQAQYHPLFIGRLQFSPPSEKQFPFRRSVYIYGLPWYADDKYIYAMLNAFGGVTKVHFDHGPDTLDRQIMNKMLEKHRVYKLLSKDSAALTMEFNAMHSKQEQYHCYWCHKQKPCCDGYYHPKRVPGSAPSYRVCLQCAAAKAEEQCSKYDARSKLLKDDKRLRELLLGLPPRPVVQCKTALCVFASQRQASKCVYVRSRLAYDGAFATHYHHYSKLKKEIALSIKPKIKIINCNKNKTKNTAAAQPKMRSVKTAPVYQSEGTAVLQQ